MVGLLTGICDSGGQGNNYRQGISRPISLFADIEAKAGDAKSGFHAPSDLGLIDQLTDLSKEMIGWLAHSGGEVQ